MSPIKGLTDRNMAFPKIGNIRKGEPKGESKFPKDLDYFRVEFDELEVEAAEIFNNHYGPEPKEILIWLPYKEISQCWDAWLEAYTAGAMVARSDGEIYLYLREPDTGRVIIKDGLDAVTDTPRPYIADEPATHYEDTKGKKQPVFLKHVGRLEVIIPILGELASLTLHTSSQYDIGQISENLAALYHMGGGSLQNIDILLHRKPKMISTPGEGGKRVRREKSLIFLKASKSWVQAQLTEKRELAEIEPIETAGELGSGITADKITGEVIEGTAKETTPPVPHVRPYDPKTLKKGLEAKVASDKYSVKKQSSKEQRGLLRMSLELAWIGEGAKTVEQKRKDVSKYLTDEHSTLKIPAPWVWVMLNEWLKPSQDSGDAWQIDKIAASEARMVWTVATQEAGQKEIPF